jgi:prolyl-tRNA editing enzyme YbaK/EbsC (Cys-tRNA(Pro) deacylase)
LRPDRDDEIAGVQDEIRCRRGECGTLAQDGDDGRAGAGAGPGIAEGASGVGRICGDRQLLDDQALGLTLQHGEPGGELGGAKDLRDGVRLVVGECDAARGALAFLVVEHQIAQPVAAGDDAEFAAAAQRDLLAHADAREDPRSYVDTHMSKTTLVIRLGSLEWRAVSADLVAPPVAAALSSSGAADVAVAPIDPALADTAAFCERYDVALEDSANCVVIAGRRGDVTSYAACVVLATTRADVNGVVRRRLGARKASFAAMDDAVRLTGMEFGGITPIGLPAEWSVLIDGAVLKREVVVIGSGIRGSKLALPPAVLVGLPAAEVIDGLAS